MLINLTCPIKPSKQQKEELNSLFKKYWHSYNVLVKHARCCIDSLEKDLEYIKLQQAYKQNKKLTKEQKAQRSNLIKHYGITQNDFEKYLLVQKRKYSLHGHTTQKLANRVYNSCRKYLFDNGDKVHFKRFDNFVSFENKTNNTGIIYRNNKIKVGKLIIPVFIRKNDNYILENLNDIHFCRIVRKWHKTKWRYYVQLVVDGNPKSQQHGEGTVGIDIGPSTIAVVSDTTVKIEEIAQNVNKVDNEIANLNRQIDVLKRRDNPNNYNEDKTIKKGYRNWIKSNEQVKLELKRRWLYQKRYNLLDYHHNCYTKNLLKLGNVFVVEDMQFDKMAKSLGKSIANHAPSKLLSLLKWKARDCVFIKVDCFKTCATQFDHTTGEYVKHGLDERIIKLGNGDLLQRDIHSAFNLKYIIISDGYYQYDIDKMNKDYKSFKQKHDEAINKILQDKLEGKYVLKSIL